MYNTKEMKTDLISQIKKQITQPIINCPSYNTQTDEWGTPTGPKDKTIEAVVYGVSDWYASLHITELHPDLVFGVYETQDEHDTDSFGYEDLNLEALFEILNYLSEGVFFMRFVFIATSFSVILRWTRAIQLGLCVMTCF